MQHQQDTVHMHIRILFWKAFYFIVNPFRVVYWYIRRPQKRGAKCLVQNGEKFLLVRLAYGTKRWSVAGGTVEKGETYEEAARREVYEETGVIVQGLREIGAYTITHYYQEYSIKCFVGEAQSTTFRLDPVEIQDAKWVTPDMLPTPRHSSVDRIMKMI